MRSYNIPHPINKKSFKQVCKYLQVCAVTEDQANQAILRCRGGWGESGTIDEYDFDKLIVFMKKFVRPLKAEDPYKDNEFELVRRRNVI